MLNNISNNGMYTTDIKIDMANDPIFDELIGEIVYEDSADFIDTSFIDEEERAFRELLKHEPNGDE